MEGVTTVRWLVAAWVSYDSDAVFIEILSLYYIPQAPS